MAAKRMILAYDWKINKKKKTKNENYLHSIHTPSS
jgi:hypothetical protein